MGSIVQSYLVLIFSTIMSGIRSPDLDMFPKGITWSGSHLRRRGGMLVHFKCTNEREVNFVELQLLS